MRVEIPLGPKQVYTIMGMWSMLDNGMLFKEWLAKEHKIFYRHEPNIGYISGDEKDIVMFMLRFL